MAEPQHITVDDRTREYLLYAPTGAKEPVPLVIVLHGGGSDPRQMEKYSQFTPLAQREDFAVVYPRSVDTNWNDGRGVQAIRAQRENIDDVKFIRAVVDDVAKDHPIDRSRIFATGISNGGMMSHRLAAEASDLVAAIVPVACAMPVNLADHFAPEHPVSILIIQGDADPLVPFAGGEVNAFGQKRGRILSTKDTLAKYMELNGNGGEPERSTLDVDPNDGTSVEIAKYPDGRGGARTWFYLVKNGGHTWPGRPGYMSERAIGKASQDFSATDLIWEFFKSCPPRKAK